MSKQSLNKIFCGRVGSYGSPYLHKSMVNPKFDYDEDVLSVILKEFSFLFSLFEVIPNEKTSLIIIDLIMS